MGPGMYLVFPVPPRGGIEKCLYGGEPFDEKLGDRAGDPHDPVPVCLAHRLPGLFLCVITML